MRVGAPFNPYKVFQGIFAPYWLLEHRSISTGAKLCYIRLLGFAGKDARCYPSLEKLGKGLGEGLRGFKDGMKGITDEPNSKTTPGETAHTVTPKADETPKPPASV